MQFPSKETIEMLRKRYPEGTRIELVYTDDPFGSIHPGDCGTVAFVDDAGGIHTKWDNGSSLAVIYGIDSFKTI